MFTDMYMCFFFYLKMVEPVILCYTEGGQTYSCIEIIGNGTR